ncbi:MAG: HlyD family efflux transporter periplasmic adaptor subunit, partial [Anaerolineales bacterium]|nr:HlyD family efflux transporter periplasmic adaptor subunit [Anaerolineales bacterium]
GIRASATVVPRQKAKLSFAQSGQIQTILIKAGEEVTAGQVIAELAGKEALQAAVTAAELEVLAAQQALDDLYTNAPLAKAQAFAAIAAAYAEVREAEYQLYYFLASTNLSGTDAIQTMQIAQLELETARQAFEAVRYKSESDPARRALKEKLDAAESNHQNALRRLELEARRQTALANLEKAKADYEKVKEGPDPKAMEMAQARLKNAQAQLEKARAAFEQATLKAPFDGTITAVEASAGETVLAGSVVAVLGNLSEFVIETSDLNERDVARVQVGQKATVWIDALGEEVEGQVNEISPQANLLGGDVVYTVMIALQEQLPGLRWGMSAEVEIITE